MADSATARPLYRPYRWASADFQLGLRPITPESWILIGADHAEIMRQKRDRLNRFRPYYYRTLTESLPAQRELRDRVTTHLVTDHPESFQRLGSLVRSVVTGQTLDLDDDSVEPLLQLSYMIEEDFMLLDEDGGIPRITAAANAYSSSGRLVASVGHDMAWTHALVPQLTQKLGTRINRVIGSVHAATPCERFNWQLTPMASVFFPHSDPHAANAAAMQHISAELRRDPARAGELLWIRVERQTLSRLPDSNATAFSLHTYSDPLSSIRSDLESLRAIRALLTDYTEERWKYSEMDMVREPLMLWLKAAASAPG
ncbi:MAG TPA: heme-dependent oxidative N-demethylase subunit alpha family protein [Burkholderiales bacterium]|nr:heme-dependent oxidative N-demethylase subunit alpha family protein [Burkholderiales bacterium]